MNTPNIRRRTFLAATLAAAGAGLAGCGFGDNDQSGGGDDGGEQEGGTLRVSMLPVTHIDPAVAGNASFGQIMMIGLWEGLVVHDPDDLLNVLPGAAESWEVSDDQLTYTFHLRDDAKWSNGDPVTAKDFEWNWKRLMTPGVAGEGRPSFNPVAFPVAGGAAFMAGESKDFGTVGAKAVDDATFEVTLETAAPNFPVKVADYWGLPLHPPTVEKLGAKWLDPAQWVSNGAYVLDAFTVNQEAALAPNEEYWDKDNYHLDRIEVTFNDGGTTADLLAYQEGSIDITGRIEDDLEAVTTSDVADELVSSPMNQMRRFVVMNSKNPALNDVRVRKALSLAIDRDALADVGKPAVPGNTNIPPTVEGHDEVPGAEFNLEEAKSLLADAGYADGDGMPVISLLDFQDSPWVQAVAQMWTDNLGIRAQPDVVEIGLYGTKRDQLHDASYAGFYVTNNAINPPTMIQAAQGFTQGGIVLGGLNLLSADGTADFVKMRDGGAPPGDLEAWADDRRPEEVQKAIDLARQAVAETDTEKQQALALDAAIAFEEAYVMLPILWGGYNLLIKPKVKNVELWPHTSVFSTKGVTVEG